MRLLTENQKMKKILLAALLTAILNMGSEAQTAESGRKDNSRAASTESIPTRFWKASLPGGAYMVALDRISSVAKHTYVVDGAARIIKMHLFFNNMCCFTLRVIICFMINLMLGWDMRQMTIWPRARLQ